MQRIKRKYIKTSWGRAVPSSGQASIAKLGPLVESEVVFHLINNCSPARAPIFPITRIYLFLFTPVTSKDASSAPVS